MWRNACLLLLLCFILSTCQTTYYPFRFERPLVNFVQLAEGDSIYYCKYEVSNLEYRNFLRAMDAEEFWNWEELIYDSTRWVEEFKLSYNAPMQRNYHWHPAYNDYPIVNISWEAANSYCDWLTLQYHRRKKRKYEQVRFRLPNKQEVLRLREHTGIFYGSDDVSAYEVFDFNLAFENNYPADGGQYTMKVHNYQQDGSGLCSIIGNVRELADDGKAYNGSWYELPSQVTEPHPYAAPDPRVGFRVVMEVLEP